ncbi:MAG: hypothetical protein II859_03100 [Bacteroidales bacterium]|nr:hypothetical protein [Bacteroidales bacterium]
MRKTTLTLLLIAAATATWAQRFDCLPKNASLACEAVRAYQSGDCETANSLFCATDSVEPVAYYPELLKYHSCAERIGDSAKAKRLLYRLVQSNGFDRESFDTWLGGFNLQARSYWPELDSLIQITESRRCRPFIDSLDAMVRKDQGVRMRIEAEGWTEDIRDQMIAIDSANTADLQALITQYGFPSWHLVGQKGAENAWLIAQHSFFYLPEYLKRYRQAVLENDAERRFLAYMEDRFLMMQGRPQIYGTQMAGMGDDMGYYPIMDMENLDRRRAAMGIRPFSDYVKSWGLDTLFICPDYLDYLTQYYPNNTNMYVGIEAHWSNRDMKGTNEWYFDQRFYDFPRDLEVLATYYLEGDTAIAVQQAKKMVLCGKRLDEKWNLPQLLMDSVKANYDELRADYERLMTKDGDAMLNSITSFDNLVKVLNSGFYPRYTYDAWNGHIKELIAQKAATLSQTDYRTFFEWLFEQVNMGNYHLFDYAELYDDVHHRLFGESYYGQKLFVPDVPLYDPQRVDERRSAIQLPPLEVWQGIKEHVSHIE